MLYGTVAKRKLPETDTQKAAEIVDMVKELLDENTPVFDRTIFIVHEIDGVLTVGMKWETE